MKNTIMLTTGIVTFVLGTIALVYVFLDEIGIEKDLQTMYEFSIYSQQDSDLISLKGRTDGLGIVSIDEDGVPEFNTDRFQFRIDPKGVAVNEIRLELESSYDWNADIVCDSCENSLVENLTIHDKSLLPLTTVELINGLYYYSDYPLKTGDNNLNGRRVKILTQRFGWDEYINEQTVENTNFTYHMRTFTPVTLIAYLKDETIIELIPEVKNTEFDIEITTMNDKPIFSSICQAMQIKDLDVLDMSSLSMLSKPITRREINSSLLKEYFYFDPSCANSQRVNRIEFFDNIQLDTSIFGQKPNRFVSQSLKAGAYKIKIFSKGKEKLQEIRINNNNVAVLTPIETYGDWQFFSKQDPDNQDIISITPLYENGGEEYSRILSKNNEIVEITSSIPSEIVGPLLFTSKANMFDPFTFELNVFAPELVVADHLQRINSNGKTDVILPIVGFLDPEQFSIVLHKPTWKYPEGIEGDLSLDIADVTLDHELLIPHCNNEDTSKFEGALIKRNADHLKLLIDSPQIGDQTSYGINLIGENEFLIQSKVGINIRVHIPDNHGTEAVITYVENSREVLCDKIVTSNDLLQLTCENTSTENFILRTIPKDTSQIVERISSKGPFNLYILNRVSPINDSTFYTSYSTDVLVELEDTVGSSGLFIQRSGDRSIEFKAATIYNAPYFSLVETPPPYIITPIHERLPSIKYCTLSAVEINKFFWIDIR